MHRKGLIICLVDTENSEKVGGVFLILLFKVSKKIIIVDYSQFWNVLKVLSSYKLAILNG